MCAGAGAGGGVDLRRAWPTTAGIESQLEPAVEHHESALEDTPLKVLVSESDVEDARDAIEALTEPED